MPIHRIGQYDGERPLTQSRHHGNDFAIFSQVWTLVDTVIAERLKPEKVEVVSA